MTTDRMATVVLELLRQLPDHDLNSLADFLRKPSAAKVMARLIDALHEMRQVENSKSASRTDIGDIESPEIQQHQSIRAIGVLVMDRTLFPNIRDAADLAQEVLGPLNLPARITRKDLSSAVRRALRRLPPPQRRDRLGQFVSRASQLGGADQHRRLLRLLAQ